ncbi:MAG: hypothetical protein OSJ74_10110, partial [Clostridia bacterium]|nr:hypothetical protein [Clostridia bacterium]
MFTKEKSKRIAVLAIILIVFASVGCVMYSLSDVGMYKDGYNGNINTTPLGRPTISTAGDLSRFSDGVKYVFTDKGKVDDFRAGNIEFEITTIVVDSAQAWGTQRNPYVITTTDEWDLFVKKISIDSTHGNGQYFVLGADLDFDGKVFHPVASFNGTFYGLGYALKNITCDTWQYWSTSSNSWVNIGTSGISSDGFSVFCKLTDAYISDTIIEKYIFTNVPISNTYISSCGPYIGGIVGQSFGDNAILNCHAFGEINNQTNYHSFNGGIVGFQPTESVGLLIYRCSVYIELTIGSPLDIYCGGIIGRSSDGITKIYDCVTEIKNSILQMKSCSVSAAIASIIQANNNVQIENFVGKVELIADKAEYSGSLCGIQVANSLNLFKNCYADGAVVPAGTSTRKAMYALSSNRGNVSVMDNVNNTVISNDYASFASGYTGYNGATYSNSNLLLDAAKAAVGVKLPSQIWDASKIGGYTPDTSPVRNYLVATVTFKNLLSGDKEEDITSVPTDVYVKGDELPSASNNSNFASYISSKPNHVFKGWTMDKSGNS